MSGRDLVQHALESANNSENGGNGYTVNLWLRSGRQVHGAVTYGKPVFKGCSALIELELWESRRHNGYARAGEDPVPTNRTVLVDADEVEQVEICW